MAIPAGGGVLLLRALANVPVSILQPVLGAVAAVVMLVFIAGGLYIGLLEAMIRYPRSLPGEIVRPPIRTPPRCLLYVRAFLLVVIVIPFFVLGCFPHHPGQAPAATATVAPDAAPTFSPDSFPDLDRATR